MSMHLFRPMFSSTYYTNINVLLIFFYLLLQDSPTLTIIVLSENEKKQKIYKRLKGCYLYIL